METVRDRLWVWGHEAGSHNAGIFDLELEAVEWTRRWIAEVGEESV